MNHAAPSLRTVGRMAEELGVPLHRVLYILRTRPQIRPVARAGRARLYDRGGLQQVANELNRLPA